MNRKRRRVAALGEELAGAMGNVQLMRDDLVDMLAEGYGAITARLKSLEARIDRLEKGRRQPE